MCFRLILCEEKLFTGLIEDEGSGNIMYIDSERTIGSEKRENASGVASIGVCNV